MGTAVASYFRPESAEDVAEVVRVFLQAEFGMEVTKHEAEGPGPAYQVDADLNTEGSECGASLMIVGGVGYVYALDEEEMEAVEAMRKNTPADRTRVMKLTETEAMMIEAHRNRDKAERPVVIAGFREPKTVPELVEIIRCVLDVNFGYCIDEHRDQTRLDIQGDMYGDGLPHTSIFFTEGEYGRDITAALDDEELELIQSRREAMEAEWRAQSAARRAEREKAAAEIASQLAKAGKPKRKRKTAKMVLDPPVGSN